jgi:SH3 domain
LNLKDHYVPGPSPAPLPPPAYASGPQILGIATALYAYTPTDAGDLALQQNDRIQVLEHMNNDCKINISLSNKVAINANQLRVARAK